MFQLSLTLNSKEKFNFLLVYAIYVFVSPCMKTGLYIYKTTIYHPNEIPNKHKSKLMWQNYFFIYRRLKNNIK